MKGKTTGVESQASGGKLPPRHSRKLRPRGRVNKHLLDTQYVHSEAETLLRRVKVGKL